jgi:hypothetical protein
MVLKHCCWFTQQKRFRAVLLSDSVLTSADLHTLADGGHLACVVLLYLIVLTPGQVDPPRHKRDSRLGAAEDSVTSHNTAPFLPIWTRDTGPREFFFLFNKERQMVISCATGHNHVMTTTLPFWQALTVGTALMPLTRLTYLSLRAQTLSLDPANPELHLPSSLQYLDLAGYM